MRNFLAINIELIFIFTDFSDNRLALLSNADLANTLGNLLSRITAPKLHPPGIRLRCDPEHLGGEDKRLLEVLGRLSESVSTSYDHYEFGHGITDIMECIHMVRY